MYKKCSQATNQLVVFLSNQKVVALFNEIHHNFNVLITYSKFMPLTVTIEENSNLIHAIYDGPFQAEVLLNYFKETWGDEKYAHHHEIFDARNMHVQTAEFTSLLMIAKSSTKTFYDNTATKKAIIVKNGEQKDFMDFYQSARSLLSIKGSSTLKLFDNIEEAKNWLDI